MKQNKFFNKNKLLKNLFDTKGVSRIVEYFLDNNIFKGAKLKKVTSEDKYFLFKLVNDPEVVKYSLSKKIINFKEHDRWFKKTIKNKNADILIFKNNNHKLGQVRFDKISKNKTIITYSVANEFRGKNIGYKMLKLAIKKNSLKTPLYAVVRKNNIASNKIFKKLGFTLFKKDQKSILQYYLKKN